MIEIASMLGMPCAGLIHMDRAIKEIQHTLSISSK